MLKNNNRKIELIVSADGSHTLYVPELDEHYHSVNGAINESMHVFIEANLLHCQKENISILEVGFGTGLNAFLTALNSKDKSIAYYTLEKHPIDKAITNQLNFYKSMEEQNLLNKIHALPWQQDCELLENFNLFKDEADLLSIEFTRQYDLVYFDAFAPEKQAEMWDEQLFQKIYDAMLPNGIFTTYCAKGVVRRSLQACGFIVERLPGPKGKREMLRAIKQ